MTHEHRSTDDFHPGDIVRVTTRVFHRGTALHSYGLTADHDYIVLDSTPDDEKSALEQTSRGVPNTVGKVTIIDPQTLDITSVGILLVDPVDRNNDTATALSQSRALAADLRAEVDELRGIIARERVATDEQVAQLRSEVEQASAATALEAHRANKAERRANRLQHAVDYANRFLPEDQKGRLQGFLDGLRRES